MGDAIHMKVLIINYYYPPMVEPHAHRWAQIAQKWADEGFSVYVIAGKVKGVPDFEKKDGVNITRVGLIRKQSVQTGHVEDKLSSTSAFSIFIKSFFKKGYRLFYWPDGLWHWFPYSFLSALSFRKKEMDLIVSYSPSFSAHLAAIILKKLSTKDSKWIADYGDPFSISYTMPPNNFSLFKGVNKFFERKVFAVADSIVFTNHETREEYRELLSCFNKKCFVIPHLVDLKLLYSRTKSSVPDGSQIKIVYLGAFHKGIREPHELFALAEKLWIVSEGKVVLHVYGPDNGFNLAGRGVPVVYHGPVNKEQAIKIMKESDLLVNVGNKNCIMVPSKIVEYIASGRPMINLGKNGGADGLINAYENVGMVFNLEGKCFASVEADLISFIYSKYKSRCSFDIIESILGEYDLKNISSRYLDSIARGGSV